MKAKMEIVKLSVSDIVTASQCTGDCECYIPGDIGDNADNC